MNVLTMQDVRKSFGALEVLKGISLTVGEGEAVSVIGPSGSGKSTLLRCATLLETMDGGSLAYGNDFAATMDAEGKSVYADKAALRRIKSRFGLVFQQFDLFPHYTVLKNVCDAPISVQKRDRAEVEAEAMALLDKANTETYGTPQPTTVPLTIEKGPFIVVSGHDLYDLHALLEDNGYAARYPFLLDLPSKLAVSTGGWEIYCIVPADEDVSITVNEFGWPSWDAEGPVAGEVLWESGSGTPLSRQRRCAGVSHRQRERHHAEHAGHRHRRGRHSRHLPALSQLTGRLSRRPRGRHGVRLHRLPRRLCA